MLKKWLYSQINNNLGFDYNSEYLKTINYDYKESLKEIVNFANNKVPFYTDRFQKMKTCFSDDIFSNFTSIPILTKDDIRNNQTKILSKTVNDNKWFYNSSGGSTGEPLRLVQDNIFNKWWQATNHFYYNNMLSIDDTSCKKIILWGSERDFLKGTIGLKAKITHWFQNTIFLNSYKMTEKDMENYINIINSYKPDLVRGYASSLFELCHFAEKNKLKIFTPKRVVSASDTLRNDMREQIERVFGTKVFNFYGSREAPSIAGECECGSIHLFMFNHYVEILDKDNNPVTKEGTEGKIVLTTLHNHSMPLIRYEIGDLVISGPNSCKCGLNLPTIKNIIGRSSENFLKEDGTIISGTALTLMFNLMSWVKSFQIIQEDYKSIKILVVLNNEINPKEISKIEIKIKTIFGGDCNISWDFIDEIPKTPNGKFIYIKSAMKKNY